MGGSLGIKGFAAAILGGFGNIPGAIVGGLAIGLIRLFAAGHYYGAYSDLVTFLVFTVIIMIRPTGLFGERTVNRGRDTAAYRCAPRRSWRRCACCRTG